MSGAPEAADGVPNDPSCGGFLKGLGSADSLGGPRPPDRWVRAFGGVKMTPFGGVGPDPFDETGGFGPRILRVPGANVQICQKGPKSVI